MTAHPDIRKPDPDLRAAVARPGYADELVPCAFAVLREAAKRWAEVKRAALEQERREDVA